MFSLEQLLFILGAIIAGVLPLYILSLLKRKYDRACFGAGYYIFVIFFVLILFSDFDRVPSLISSLVISELTLALVWVELSKRPELKLLDFIPIVLYSTEYGPSIVSADSEGILSKPTGLLRIREVSDPKKKFSFDEKFSFSVYLANIGYEQIPVYEYLVILDNRQNEPKTLVATLRTQERHRIEMSSLNIRSPGLHKILVEVRAATVKCSKEIWFFISKDLQKLRYMEMSRFKLLLSPFIKMALKDP